MFAAVVHLEMFRAIMALVVVMNLKAGSWDVIAAFLNALIDSRLKLYVHSPPGYETFDSKGNLLIWFLLRALYGLR